MLWFSSKPKKKFAEKLIAPDAIKWRADKLLPAFVHHLRYKLFDKLIKPWGLKVFFLNEKMKKKKQIQKLYSNLNFQTDHLLPALHTLMFVTWVKARPQHRELGALLFTNIILVLWRPSELRFERGVTSGL